MSFPSVGSAYSIPYGGVFQWSFSYTSGPGKATRYIQGPMESKGPFKTHHNSSSSSVNSCYLILGWDKKHAASITLQNLARSFPIESNAYKQG